MFYVVALVCVFVTGGSKRFSWLTCEKKKKEIERGWTTIIVLPFEDKMIMEEQMCSIWCCFSFLGGKLCIFFLLVQILRRNISPLRNRRYENFYYLNSCLCQRYFPLLRKNRDKRTLWNLIEQIVLCRIYFIIRMSRIVFVKTWFWSLLSLVETLFPLAQELLEEIETSYGDAHIRLNFKKGATAKAYIIK